MAREIQNDEKSILQLLATAEKIRIAEPLQSVSHVQNALTQAKYLNNKSLVATCLKSLAFYYMILCDYDKSLSIANEALQLIDPIKKEEELSDLYYTMGSVYYKTNNMHYGLKYLVESLSGYKKHNNYVGQAKCYKALGTIYEYYNDIENAMISYDLTIKTAEKENDLNMISNAYNPLSGLYLEQNNVAKATELIEASIKLKTQTGDIKGIAFAYYGYGKICFKIEDYNKAELYFWEAANILKAKYEMNGLTMCYLKLGALYAVQNNMAKAKEMYLLAFNTSAEYKISMTNSKASFALYTIFKNETDSINALKYLEKYNNQIGNIMRNQTHQIVSSYNMIQILKAQSEADKIELEKIEILEKKNKAEYAAQARQDLLSNMSHEIRTPLNAIVTIPKLLKDRSNSEEQQLLEALQQTSKNLQSLINDILDFSKLEAGKMELDESANSLYKLILNVKNIFAAAINEKGLQLELDIDDIKDKYFLLDEVKMLQIFSNLVSNAIKFTKVGKISIAIKIKEIEFNKYTLHCSVTDTGIGISKHLYHDIFNAFTQLKTSKELKQPGTGLGLAIIKKLIELHNSSINVESVLDVGSCFSFDLKLQNCIPVTENNSTSKTLNKALNVLIVEDNNINTLVAKKLLEKWEINTDTASNGKEAVEKSMGKYYDIILMDMHMPIMNGYEATTEIRTKLQNNKTKIFALTADISYEYNANKYPHFTGFLRKPIEPDKLYEILI